MNVTESSMGFNANVRDNEKVLDDRNLILSSRLFNAGYYLQRYPDVAFDGGDPLSHYLLFGGAEGRSPSEDFDGDFYLKAYPDVATDGMNPLVHYLRHGLPQGRLTLSVPLAEEENVVTTPDQADLDRALIRESRLFDQEFYCRKYSDIDPALMDPFEHYVTYGASEGRQPSAAFDSSWYLREYPDVRDSGLTSIVHYLRVGKAEGRLCQFDKRIFNVAKDMVLQAGLMESSILLDQQLADPSTLYVNDGNQGWPGMKAWRGLYDSLDRPYAYIVFVPWLVRGGADIVAANMVKAATDMYGIDSTLIVLTDYDRTDAIDWLPVGSHIRVLSDYEADLPQEHRTVIVELLIRCIRPKAVLNVNSRACWDAIVTKGGALSKATDIYACLFCRDYTANGIAAGYSDTHFRAGVVFLKKAYFDNTAFLHQLADDFGLPLSVRSKLVTLYQPILNAPALARPKLMNKQRPQVIWAGRFSKQKNVDILIQIAELATDFDFDIYGYGDSQYVAKLEKATWSVRNLRLKGKFASISELPLSKYDVLLYTSLWDGLPLTLADIAARGLPVVASAVGGIPELLTSETGWPIIDYQDPLSYVSALREVKYSPETAIAKTELMIRTIEKKHSWFQYLDTLKQSPSFLD